MLIPFIALLLYYLSRLLLPWHKEYLGEKHQRTRLRLFRREDDVVSFPSADVRRLEYHTHNLPASVNCTHPTALLPSFTLDSATMCKPEPVLDIGKSLKVNLLAALKREDGNGKKKGVASPAWKSLARQVRRPPVEVHALDVI